MAGKSVYLTEKELNYLMRILDPVNAHEDEEVDEIRNRILEKVDWHLTK